MIKITLSLCCFLAVAVSLTIGNSVSADEVVINDSTRQEEKQLGDYHFSTFPLASNTRCDLTTNSDMVNEITAGELWSYFDSQGLTSVNKLVICLDVDEVPHGQALGLDLFEVRFEDSSDSFTLGDNSLILTADGTNALRPECHLQVELDYDFMEKYSKDSKEKIQLNFGVNGKATLGLVPTFSVEGRSPMFYLPNITLLAWFCVFWCAVFFLLRKFTINEPAKQQQINPALAEAKVV